MPGRRSLKLAWVLGVGLGLLPGGPRAAAEDAAESRFRYAREQLLTEARGVETVAQAQDTLNPLRDALALDRAAVAAWRAAGGNGTPEERRAWEEIASIVAVRERALAAAGEGEEGVAAGADGALAEALWLRRWLRGLEVCDVTVKSRGSGPVATYRYPAGGGALPVPEPVPAPGTTAPEAPPAGPKPADPKVAPPKPPEPPAVDADPWSPFVLEVVRKEGTLGTKTLATQPCREFTALLETSKAFGNGTPTAAVFEPAEASFEWNEPTLRLRAAQSRERIESWAKESPSRGLLDESTVREKARRTTERRDMAASFEQRRAETILALDTMVRRSYALRRDMSILAGRLEEEQRAASAPTTPPDGAATLSWRARWLESREALASLELRLLYAAALRADLRAKFLAEAARLAQDEARAAELAQGRFEEELRRLRGERQGVRLEHESDVLEVYAGDARRDLAAASAEAAPPIEARVAVYDAFLRLNAVVREAAGRRRAATKAEPVPRAAAASAEKAAQDALLPFRAPDAEAIDAGYAGEAMRHVGELDAPAIARNHEATARKIAALEARAAELRRSDDLEARFGEAFALATTAVDRFATVAPRWEAGTVRGFRADLERYRQDYDEARAGLAQERSRTEEQLTALRRFRAALTRQGVRSLAIRERPEVSPRSVQDGFAQVLAGVEQAFSWLTFRGERHLGHFVEGHLPALGLLLGLALLLGILVVRLRRAIDRGLDAAAARDPRLALAGASVATERAAATAQREQAAAATRATEEAVLRQAAGEEVDPAVLPPPASAPTAAPAALPAPPESASSEGGR